jgi:hypothetical protein
MYRSVAFKGVTGLQNRPRRPPELERLESYVGRMLRFEKQRSQAVEVAFASAKVLAPFGKWPVTVGVDASAIPL